MTALRFQARGETSDIPGLPSGPFNEKVRGERGGGVSKSIFSSCQRERKAHREREVLVIRFSRPVNEKEAHREREVLVI